MPITATSSAQLVLISIDPKRMKGKFNFRDIWNQSVIMNEMSPNILPGMVTVPRAYCLAFTNRFTRVNEPKFASNRNWNLYTSRQLSTSYVAQTSSIKLRSLFQYILWSNCFYLFCFFLGISSRTNEKFLHNI